MSCAKMGFYLLWNILIEISVLGGRERERERETETETETERDGEREKRERERRQIEPVSLKTNSFSWTVTAEMQFLTCRTVQKYMVSFLTQYLYNTTRTGSNVNIEHQTEVKIHQNGKQPVPLWV